jgi:hypothetical protein
MNEPVNPDRFYTSAEVARLLFGRSVEWFYAHRSELTQREGFPLPISRIGQPRWRGADLLAWGFASRDAWATLPRDRPSRTPQNGPAPNFDALRKKASRYTVIPK